MDIYTDGGCHGNPGPGAWAFVAVGDQGNHEAAGYENPTTNNRMELSAVIQALQWAGQSGQTSVRIFTDSQYVQKGITQWIHSWVRNGWKTANKDEVKNKDLWQNLLALSKTLPVSWQWVKGHAGNPLNERCDELVQEAIHRQH